MIQARVTIFAHPSHREDIVRTIRTLVTASRLDPTCHNCRLYADVADPNALTLVEEWATEADFDRRLRSADYGRLLQLLELSHYPPETVFHTVCESRGLEAVERIRLPQGARGRATIKTNPRHVER